MNANEIEAIVKSTVHETLMALGVDVENPMQVQRDFAALRTWRTSLETVRKQGLIVAVGILVAGFMGLVWVAIHGGAPPPSHQ